MRLHEPATRKTRAYLLCVLLFGFTQLAIAGHQFKHDAGPATDVCAVCLQVDQLDVPQAEQPALPSIAPAAVATGGHRAFAAPADPCRHFDSRAPPRY